MMNDRHGRVEKNRGPKPNLGIAKASETEERTHVNTREIAHDVADNKLEMKGSAAHARLSKWPYNEKCLVHNLLLVLPRPRCSGRENSEDCTRGIPSLETYLTV